MPSPSVVAADEPQSGRDPDQRLRARPAGAVLPICAGLAAAGASIVDARIHTTKDGMALDNLLVQDSPAAALCRPAAAGAAGQGGRGGARRRGNAGAARARRCRAAAPPSTFAPSVVVAEQASTRTTVVEVNARDREGLLARLALAIHGQGLQVRSAHIATYGERAVDVFYLTRGDGAKLAADDVAALREALLAAASEPRTAKPRRLNPEQADKRPRRQARPFSQC